MESQQVYPRDNWEQSAECRGMDPNVFFPTDGLGVQAAQKICSECPVRPDCLEFALKNHTDHGIWGGVSERERRRLQRGRRVANLAGQTAIDDY